MTQTTTTAQDTRREEVYDFVVLAPEPLTCEEVAHGTGLNPGTVNGDLKYLVTWGSLASRTETDEERAIRYNGTSRGKNSSLYWAGSHVPARTTREVVLGYVATAGVVSRTSSKKVNKRLAGIFRINSGKWKFTVAKLNRLTKGVASVEALRHRVRSLEEAGLVRDTGTFDSGKRVFQVVDKDGILAFLDPKPRTVVTEAPEASAGSLAARIAALQDEARQVAAQVPALEETVATLETALEEARQRLAEAREVASILDA